MGAAADTTTGMAPALEARSIDPAEIEKFERMADEWWDPKGKFRPLHLFNPARLGILRDVILQHFGRQGEGRASLEGLRLLDIGCGGGLVAEPMARLGASVTGIDASARNIAVSSLHADRVGLRIDYRAVSAEALAESGETFHVVLNLEVVEHVLDIEGFIETAAALVAPGGIMIVATLNRTLKSLALAKIGAEHVLRWLPPGTHDWRRFVPPAALRSALERAGLEPSAPIGVSFNPLTGRWSKSADTSVNYMMSATRPPAVS